MHYTSQDGNTASFSSLAIWLSISHLVLCGHMISCYPLNTSHNAEILLIIYSDVMPPSSGQGLLQGEGMTIVGTHMVPYQSNTEAAHCPLHTHHCDALCREVA